MCAERTDASMQGVTAGVTAGGSCSFPLGVTVNTDLTQIDFAIRIWGPQALCVANNNSWGTDKLTPLHLKM